MTEIGRVNTRLGTTEARMINTIAEEIHRLNDKWWRSLDPCGKCGGSGNSGSDSRDWDTATCSDCSGTGHPVIRRNDGEMIALMHSELSEALEGHRKSLPDDKLPHRPMVEVEMADCVIRIMDYCYARGLDLGGAIVEKCEYNYSRIDHSIEHRRLEHGKKY